MQKGIVYRHVLGNYKDYIGKTLKTIEQRAGKDYKGYEGQLVFDKIQEHGVIKTEILYEVPVGCLNTFEQIAIRKHRSHVSQNGYNVSWGGDGFDSKTAREINLKRVEEGTNPFLGGEIQRKHARKLIEAGTHNFLGDKHPVHKQIKDGTHPFLGGEIQRKSAQKRIEAGTHHFLGGEIARKSAQKRIEAGTHHFLDSEFQRRVSRRGRYAQRQKWKNIRRYRYRLMASLLFTKSLCQIYRTRQLTREGFFDKELPNTEQSEQLELF